MKKWILWTVYAAFVGLLIVGAVRRTSATLNDGDAGQSGHADVPTADNHGDESGQHGQGTDTDTHGEQTSAHDMETLTGTVTALTNREMVVQVDEGAQLVVSRRSWRFAREQGFTPQIGDRLALTGFYENDEFAAVAMENLTSGQTAALRDEHGHPLWAGNGE